MKFFELIPPTNIDFIGKFKFFMAISGLLVILSAVGVFTKGLNFGIDFTGGSVIQVHFKSATDIEQIRKIMEELGEAEASVVALDANQQDYMITARSAADTKAEPLNKRFLGKVGSDKVTIQSADIVGPKVGAELKSSAVQALIYSILLITIYIWMRFDFKFAPGATIAMIHDLMMAVGFYLLTGREFTITAVAALLTIAGYSVNDTIVIYDRVREMLKSGAEGLPLSDTINKAVNLTLSRTILTGMITLVSIVPLIFFASGEIQSFAIAMVFGIFVGMYSTVYIASPFTIYVEKWTEKKKGVGRKPGARSAIA